MDTTYNRSTPPCSYTAAMDALARKLDIHSRASGKDAVRALDEALVHARDAAHARVFSKQLARYGRGTALQVAEDIAQSVALSLFDGRARAKIIGKLPSLTTADSRKRWFGKVIYFTSCTAMRRYFRGPRCVSLDEPSSECGGTRVAQYIDSISIHSAVSSDLIGMLDSLRTLDHDLKAVWRSSKTSTKVSDWSPTDEIFGLADESDRPSTDALSKRTRERRLEEAKAVKAKWLKRHKEIDGPSL